MGAASVVVVVVVVVVVGVVVVVVGVVVVVVGVVVVVVGVVVVIVVASSGSTNWSHSTMYLILGTFRNMKQYLSATSRAASVLKARLKTHLE